MPPVSVTPFSCQRGCLTIRGLIYRPQGERLPIAILSHGFLANYHSVQSYAQWLAERGYLALCFDFNGGGPEVTSDPDTTQMTIFTEVEDLKTVIAYAKTLESGDPNSILLLGCSQGGIVSALAAKDLGHEIHKLILFYPAFCIPDDADKGEMLFAKFDPQNVPEFLPCGSIQLGRAYATTMQNFDLLGEVSQYQGKVLILSGTQDPIVAPRYVTAAQKAYPNAELFLIEGAGYSFTGTHKTEVLNHLEAFLSAP